MTALFSPHATSSFLAVQAPDLAAYMSNDQSFQWHQHQEHDQQQQRQQQQPHHRYPQNPVSTSYVNGGPPQMGRLNDLDMRLYQAGQSSYNDYAGATSQMLSPDLAGTTDPHWPSDMDIGTPSTAHSGGFSNDMMDAFSFRHSPMLTQPPAPQKSRSNPGSLQGVQTWPVPGGAAAAAAAPIADSRSNTRSSLAQDRPTLHRAHTGPERSRRAPVPKASPTIKRSGSEESDEEEYAPGDGAGAETKEQQGPGRRKRQRIPHTAVERRYRENLNAHLDRLRQAVPALASRRSSGSKPAAAAAAADDGAATSASAAAQGVKPSKCEILSGAIEHIGNLDRENDGLRGEVQVLRGRIQELERWYGGGMRAGPYN